LYPHANVPNTGASTAPGATPALAGAAPMTAASREFAGRTWQATRAAGTAYQ
jgi:hypothetical protein